MIRASGVIPSSRARVTHYHDRGRAVVQGAGVACRHLSARLERRLELRELVEGRVRSRPVVLCDAVPGSDLALEEPGFLRGDGALLRLLSEAIHVLAGDVPLFGDVLRGQAHRDVDVRDRRVVAEQLRVQLLGVLRIAVDLCDRFDARSHVGVALARANRMERHTDRLQARRAEAIHCRAWDGLWQPGKQGDAPTEVHALFLLREAAADHHVDDLGRIELGDLLQRGVDGERGEIVGTSVDERALARATDRRSGGRDDHRFRHRVPPPPCRRPHRRAPASPCLRSRSARRRTRRRSARAAPREGASRASARASPTARGS